MPSFIVVASLVSELHWKNYKETYYENILVFKKHNYFENILCFFFFE